MDHIGGNDKIMRSTGCKLYAHKNAKNSIPNINYGLNAGDILKFGKSLELSSRYSRTYNVSCMSSSRVR